MKKTLSLFLVLLTVFSLLAPSAAADGEAPSPAEEALRLAIKNGETEYTLYDDLTLSADLIIPVKFTLTVEEGCTLTVPDGVTFTVNGDLQIDGSVAVAAGGKLSNASLFNNSGFAISAVQVSDGGALTVSDGGALENLGFLVIDNGGSVCVNGSFTWTDEMYYGMQYSVVRCTLPCGSTAFDLPGIPPECVTLVYLAHDAFNEEDMLSALSLAETVPNPVHIRISYVTIILHSDTEIGENVTLELVDGVNIVAAPGTVLTNRGSIEARTYTDMLHTSVGLIAEPGAEIRNYGKIYFLNNSDYAVEIRKDAAFWSAEPWDVGFEDQMSIMYRLTGGGERHRLYIYTDPESSGKYLEAGTAEELAFALDAGVETVRFSSEIVCGQDITVPEGVRLWIQAGGALTVAEGYRLTNNGSVRVDGSLTVDGDYAGKGVSAYESAVVTPDSVPRVTELIIAEQRVEGAPPVMETESLGGFSVSAFAETGEWLSPDAVWSIETDIADATVDPETGLLYTGSSPGELILRATTEYGTCEKAIQIVPGENTNDDEDEYTGPEAGLTPWGILICIVLPAVIVIAAVCIFIAVRRKKEKK